jgi:NAD(P)-dependent dehydrogenase (short-subunit alcohol dehydrogenase family)
LRISFHSYLTIFVIEIGVAHINALELIELKDFQSVLNVNVLGVLAVTQSFLPLLRRCTQSLKSAHCNMDGYSKECCNITTSPALSFSEAPGRIVIIGSAAGFIAPLFYGAYSASKYAIEVTNILF